MGLAEGQQLDVVKVDRLSDFTLKLAFSDGTSRAIDFKPFLEASLNPHIRAYSDLSKFESFTIVHGNLVWGDYDMCFPIEALYEGALERVSPRASHHLVAESRMTYGGAEGRKRKKT